MSIKKKYKLIETGILGCYNDLIEVWFDKDRNEYTDDGYISDYLTKFGLEPCGELKSKSLVELKNKIKEYVVLEGI